MQLDIESFRAMFFEEAAEHVSNLETVLLQLETEPTNDELLNTIFRAAHSIKGGSGSFGFTDVTRFTHVLESLLDQIRQGRITWSPDLANLLLRATDMLRALLACAHDNAPAPAETNAIIFALEASLAGSPAAPHAPAEGRSVPPSTNVFDIRFVPHGEIFLQGNDPGLLIRNLGRTGELLDVRADLSGLPALADLDPEMCYLRFDITARGHETELRDVFAFVDDGELSFTSRAPAPAIATATTAAGTDTAPVPEATPVAKEARVAVEGATLRVATDKVDKIINLVGELVIAQAMITQAMRGVHGEALAQLTEAIGMMVRNTTQLQEHVMSVRMVPISTVFRRYPRLVRDLAASLGKEIALELVGDLTELDKSMIEGIGDPLTHLVRNAIDHGIEPAHERVRAGKPARGTVRLSASHQGGGVMIEIQDDGRGLDPERIRAKAIERGLLDPLVELTEQALYDLVFLPGFSTATAVSDLSGRGVGMDVVKRNIEALSGTVTLSSRPGRGTTCVIRLPLTLAILDGLTLGVGGERFIVPLVNVIESLQPAPGDIYSLCGSVEMLRARGETVRLVSLHRLLGLVEPERRARRLVTLVEASGTRLALEIDELLGQSQVVIKSLETNYRRVDGMLGATILGDGRVALILDVQALVNLANGKGRLAA